MKTSRTAKLADDGIKRTGLMVGREEILQSRARLSRNLLRERSNKAGLADAGLAGNQHDLSLAVLCLPPAAQKQFEFLIAPYQWRQLVRPQRFEAALDLALAQNLPGLNRVGIPLDR